MVRTITFRGPRPAGGGSGTWPFSVSADGRRIITAQGASWQGNGITPWSLFVQTDSALAEEYIADRADGRRVNAMLANILEHAYSDQTPAWLNRYGDAPFTGTLSGGLLDFTTPNPDYFAYVQEVVGRMLAHGVTAFLTPCYIGFGQGGEGWGSEVAANGVSRMQALGEYLGDLLKNHPNVVWVGGGDSRPDAGDQGDLTAHHNALMNGVLSADPAKLATAHSGRTRSAVDDYDQSWLALNSAYSNNAGDANDETWNSWGQAAKPVVYLEGNYYDADDQAQRQQAYASLLAGAVCHFMGINGDWTLSAGWEAQLGQRGAQYLPFVRQLQEARDLTALTPDRVHAVVSAYDEDAVRYSSQQVVAYTAGGGLTVNLGVLSPGTYDVRWYDPVTGASQQLQDLVVSGPGSRTFDPPGERVLLIDDQSLGLGAP